MEVGELVWVVEVRMKGEGYATRSFRVVAATKGEAEQKALEYYVSLLTAEATAAD